MRRQNQVQQQSYSFAISIIDLYKKLKAQKEFTLGRQILKSGTSIGANVEEAIGASSRKDFIHKITIAYKEARESSYWLRLLSDTGHLTENESRRLKRQIDLLLRLLGSIQKNSKTKSIKKPIIL